jgi:hypothetical protein
VSKRGFLGFEAKHHPVLPRKEFAKRMARSFALASSLERLTLGLRMDIITVDWGIVNSKDVNYAILFH